MTDLRYTFKTTPYAHQRRALAKLVKLEGNALLALPMRTGKTKTTIDWAGIAYHNFGLRRVLVVTPAAVMHVWQDEIALHCPVPSRVTLLSGRLVDRKDQVQALRNEPFEGIDWLIVNYEGLTSRGVVKNQRETDEQYMQRWKAANRVRLETKLIAWKPDLVVSDECHKLKTASSAQSKALSRLGSVARMRIGLTGTPVTKSPLDFYGQFRFVDPTVFSSSWTQFKDYYGVWGGYHNKELKGYNHLDELLPKMRAHSFRVKAEDCYDVPKNLPDVIVPVHLSASAQQLYRTMAKEMIVELESGKVSLASIILTKLLRLSQITSGFLKAEDGSEEVIDSGKLDACMGLIENMTAQDEKVVVFCRFKHDYHAIEQACRKRGIGSVTLSGETSKDSERIIKQFRDDPKVMVFIAQTQAGSLGIDLTAARFNIWYSLDYNWATYAQALERIGGPKQKRPTGNYYLVAPKTVDGVVLNVLKNRGKLAQAVLHDPKLLLDSPDGLG